MSHATCTFIPLLFLVYFFLLLVLLVLPKQLISSIRRDAFIRFHAEMTDTPSVRIAIITPVVSDLGCKRHRRSDYARRWFWSLCFQQTSAGKGWFIIISQGDHYTAACNLLFFRNLLSSLNELLLSVPSHILCVHKACGRYWYATDIICTNFNGLQTCTQGQFADISKLVLRGFNALMIYVWIQWLFFN